ncbi:MAG TPA: hypothetical protein VFB58_12575 [Chloroflexota bacterium]|nr:hypothetical protein [Chloroflexota bacterium]
MEGHRLQTLGMVLLSVVLAGCQADAASRGTQPAGSWHHLGLDGQIVHAVIPERGGSLLAAAGPGVFRRSATGSWTLLLRAPTVWSVAAARDDRMIVAGDNQGYVHVSGDGGATWRQQLVSAAGVYAVTIQPGHPNVLLAAGGGIYRSANFGRTWRRVHGIGSAAADAFAWAPGNRRTVWAGSVATGSGGSVGIFVSHDAGFAWRPLTPPLPSPNGVMSLHADPGSLIAGTMGFGAWRFVHRHWLAPSPAMAPRTNHIAGLAAVPGRPAFLLAGSLTHGVYITRDGGRHWSVWNGGLSPADARIVLAVAVAPDTHTVYAGTAHGLYTARLPVTTR